MFPSFNTVKKTQYVSEEDKLRVMSLCPLGCLCCIMQQFYNRRCWCKEVKESTGTQTDPVDLESLIRPVVVKKSAATVATQTDAKENFPPPLNTAAENDIEQRKMAIELQHALKKIGCQENNSESVKSFRTGGMGVLNRAPADPSSWKVRLKEVTSSEKKLYSNENTTNKICHQVSPQSTPEAMSVPIASNCRYESRKSKILKNPEPFWKNYVTHGTTEHSALQTAVNDTMDKYDLTGARHPNFETALEELLDLFPNLRDTDSSMFMLRNKLRHRISSRRHYTRIKSEASAIGIAVSTLKRKRMEENAIQHRILGESMVRNSLNQTPPTPKCDLIYGKASFLLKPISHDDVKTRSPPDLRPVATPPGLNPDILVPPDLPPPPVAHSTPSSDTGGREPRGEPHFIDLWAKGWSQQDASALVKQECDDESSLEVEEALDLSDPRHEVIIKIEPMEKDDFT